MKVLFSKKFEKSFKKRIENSTSESDFWISLDIFLKDPFSEKLRTHKLSGRLNELWSFSINYKIRVLFYLTSTNPYDVIFIDIGNHDEVY